MKPARPTFTLVLRAEENAADLHGLRRLLKRLLRDCGLRCILLHADEQRERDSAKGHAQ
jgi:hypothetical protein